MSNRRKPRQKVYDADMRARENRYAVFYNVLTTHPMKRQGLSARIILAAANRRRMNQSPPVAVMTIGQCTAYLRAMKRANRIEHFRHVGAYTYADEPMLWRLWSEHPYPELIASKRAKSSNSHYVSIE